jgi:hypothetical protein
MLPVSDRLSLLIRLILSTILDFLGGNFAIVWGKLMQETWKFAEIFFSIECLIEE